MKSKSVQIALLSLVIIFSASTISSTLKLNQKTLTAGAEDANGLVALYTFDDGTATDFSGSGNNGTINGATAVAGKVGAKALSFDGNDNVIIPHSDSLSPNDFTISFWINSTNANTQRVIEKTDSYLIRYSGGGTGGMQIIKGIFFDSKPVQTGIWTHVTFTGDATGYKWYVNGSLSTQDSRPWVGASGGNNPLTFGGSIDPYTGLLDDVRIYNRAISAGEVASLYALGGGTVNPNPTPGATAVNGSCSTTLNMCSVGTFSDQTDTSTQALWQCTGSNGGTTASCSSTLSTSDNTPSNFSTYYVDFEGGDDKNDGGSPTTAWKHVPGVKQDGTTEATDRAKATTLKPGNTVLFKGGVKYRGLVPLSFAGTASQPIVYKGDGWSGLSGVKAIIDGSSPVTGWTQCSSSDAVCAGNTNSGSIYYADIKVPSFLTTEPALSLNAYQNDQPLTPAQYPNALNPLYPLTKNFLSVPLTSVTPTSLTDTRLSQFSNLTGKWIYIWVNPNATVPRKILSHGGSTITFESTQTYTDRDTLYAIVNAPNSNVFDKSGEYYLDETVRPDGMRRLYVWPLQNQNLASSGGVTIGAQLGGIGGYYPNNLTIEGFKVQYQTGDSYGEGNAIGGGGSVGAGNLIIRNNEISGVRASGSAAILIGSVPNRLTNVYIEDNYIHDNPVDGRGIQVANTMNAIVRNNTIKNIAGTAIYFPGSYDSSIIGNTIVDGGGAHANGISVYQGSQNVTVANNYVSNFGATFTFESSSGLNIYNNVFVGFPGAGYVVAEWGNMTGTNRFYNNTVVGSSNSAAVFFSSKDYISKQNNIIDAYSFGATVNDSNKNLYVAGDGVDQTLVFKAGPRLQTSVYSLESTSKLWIQGYQDIPKVGDTLIVDADYTTPRTITAAIWTIYKGNYAMGITFTPPLGTLSAGVVSVWKDRNYTSDYHLNSASPAINAGLSMASFFTTDKDGISRPQAGAWDIGAYEYTGTVSTPPPTTFVAGDFNKDGVVNSIDFSLMAGAWNTNNSIYDLNKDGTVNTLDYSIMVQNWTR